MKQHIVTKLMAHVEVWICIETMTRPMNLQEMGIISWQFQVSFSYVVVSCFHAFVLKRKKRAVTILQQSSATQVSALLICFCYLLLLSLVYWSTFFKKYWLTPGRVLEIKQPNNCSQLGVIKFGVADLNILKMYIKIYRRSYCTRLRKETCNALLLKKLIFRLSSYHFSYILNFR